MTLRGMGRRLRAVGFTAVCVISTTVQPWLAASAVAEPGAEQNLPAVVADVRADVVGATATPSIYWGAFVFGWPGDVQHLDAFERAVGRHMSIVHWGQPWVRNGEMQPFQTPYYEAVRARGSIPLVDWGSWDTCCSLDDQPDFRLSAIASGAWDEYVTQWAQAAQAWGKPFFLRFDHEMNGWWYPWGELVNANQPGDFVAAWRHVHDLFVQQGATNVTWVWCPNIVGPYSTPMPGLYPGDDYVDWTCMDGYNWGHDRGNDWQSFAEVFSGTPRYGGHDTYRELLALAPSKPIMIGETASSENGGSKPDWIRDMLDLQLPINYPAVKALVWYDRDGGDPTMSWTLSSSEPALRAFNAGIASTRYAGNAYATLEVSPIPPAEVLVPRP